MPSSAHNLGEGLTGGNKAAQGFDAAAAAATGLDNVLKNIDKSLNNILGNLNKMSGSMKGMGASLGGGLGGSTQSSFSADLNQGISAVQTKLDAAFNIPKTGMDYALTGAKYAAIASTAAMGLMPNTSDAVTQRLSAEAVGSMSGLNPLKLISSSNALLAGGMTGPQSGSASTAILSSTGILPTMGSYQNIMKQVGGLSVMTGMSNEQSAAGFGGINGMNFLRMGIRPRNPDGSLRDPNELANDLYHRMYGNRKITQEQAAQVFNPYSRAHQDIMQAAGGDASLFQSLATMTIYQAKNGGKQLDMSSQNVKDNILNLRGDSPTRALFNYQGSQAKNLEATGAGLVQGYDTALNTTAATTNLFASIAKFAGPIATGLERLKGILDILPQAGNTGAMLTSVGAMLGGKIGSNISTRLESSGINSVLNAMGNGTDAMSSVLSQGTDPVIGLGSLSKTMPTGAPTMLGRNAMSYSDFMQATGGDPVPPEAGGNEPVSPEAAKKIFEKFKGGEELAGDGSFSFSSLLSKGGRSGLRASLGLGEEAGTGALLRGGLKSMGSRMFGNPAGALMGAQLVNMAGNWAIPKLQQYGQKHFSKNVNKWGTIAARTGQWAATGALVGSAIPVVGTAVGAILGTAYGAYRGWQDSKQFDTAGDGQQDPNTGGDTGYTRDTWAASLLKRLSISETKYNREAITNWEAKEGGHWANPDKYNPLNTTQHMPGSHGTNSADVQAYTSWDQGFGATVKTLGYKGVGYETILKSLKTGKSDDIYQAVVDSHWGTNELMGHKKNTPYHGKGNSGTPTTTEKDKNHIGGRYRPTGGPITANYGQKPKNNTYWQWKGYHTGTDFGVPKGTEVYAFSSGTVTRTGTNWDGEAYGQALLIDHGGYQSFYAHLSDTKVSTGAKVTGGQVVALSGQSGSGAKKGPHLHFEIRKGNDNPVNPASKLAGLIPTSPIIAGIEDAVGDAVGSITKAAESIFNPFFKAISNSAGSMFGLVKSIFDEGGGRTMAPGDHPTKDLTALGASSGSILSSDPGGFNPVTAQMPSTFTGNSVDLMTSSPGFGGDTHSDYGMPQQATLTANHNHNVTINMNVTVTNGSTQDAVNLARNIKTILEKDLRVNKLGEF